MDSKRYILSSDIEPTLIGNSFHPIEWCLSTDRAVHTFSPAGLIVSNPKQKISIKDNHRLLHAIEYLQRLELDDRNPIAFCI